MLDPLNSVMNDYGSLLQLRDKLTALSNTSPVIATILIFVMAFIGINMVATQTIELQKKFAGEWRAQYHGLDRTCVGCAACGHRKSRNCQQSSAGLISGSGFAGRHRYGHRPAAALELEI